MNSVKIEMNIGGREFELSYDIPDAIGEISPTDLNATWLDERFRVALRAIVGRPVLRMRAEAPTPILVKPAAKRVTAAGAL